MKKNQEKQKTVMGHRKILRFIKSIRDSFIGATFVYTHGSCYQFYLVLKSVIPDAEAYYDGDHVITKIRERFYDITGEVDGSNHLSVDQHYHHDIFRKLKFKIEIVDSETLKKAIKESK